MKEYKKLIKEGFVFADQVFSYFDSENSKNAFWSVINCEYDTGIEPETRFWNPGDDPKDIIKIDKPHLSSKIIFDLITNQKFGESLAKITNSKKIQVWHSQGVCKPSGGGHRGNAGWHRDIQYWPFWEPSGVLTAWIALTDVSPNSGPVRYIVGSNHWGNIEGTDFFNKDVNAQDVMINKYHKKYKIVDAVIPAGSISVHSSRTYHSSVENNSDCDRIGMVVHFATDLAKRVNIGGENSKYLDILDDQSICPVIYDS